MGISNQIGKKKLAFLLVVVLAALLTLSGCGKEMELLNERTPKDGEEIAVLHTSMGDMSVMFFENVAPKAVKNFKTHAKDGYYDGLTFHRVMNDFMIQGGDPEGTGAGGKSIWDEPFEDEFSDGARNIRGALSMANAGPKTNGSQFFIVQAGPQTITDATYANLEQQGYTFTDEVKKIYKKHGGTPWLDGHHTVFGQVYEGMDIVDQIAAVSVDENDKPLEAVLINSIEIKAYQAK